MIFFQGFDVGNFIIYGSYSNVVYLKWYSDNFKSAQILINVNCDVCIASMHMMPRLIYWRPFCQNFVCTLQDLNLRVTEFEIFKYWLF